MLIPGTQFSDILTHDAFLCQSENSIQVQVVVAQAVNMRKNRTQLLDPRAFSFVTQIPSALLPKHPEAHNLSTGVFLKTF